MYAGEIAKEETYNPYGDAERMVEIKALRGRGGARNTFIRVPQMGVTKGELFINGRFVYTRNPSH